MIWETVNTLRFYLSTFFLVPAVIILVLSLKSVKGQGKKEKEETVNGSRGYLWMIAGLLVVFVWYNFNGVNFKRTPSQTRETMPQYTQHQEVVSEQEVTGILTWYKEGVTGSGAPASVKIERNDSNVLEFTTKYGAHYKWDKSKEECGEWYQDFPKDSGRWYLKQKGEGVLGGWLSDDKDGSGANYVLKLEIDK